MTRETTTLRSSRLGRFTSVLAIAILTGASLYYLGQDVFRIEVVPVGDFAADLLLESRIDAGEPLLVGHYSRLGFNHPGRFFFYVTHALHILFEDVQLPVSGAAFATSALVNGAFIVFAAYLFARVWPTTQTFWPMLVGFLLIVSLMGPEILSVWMPNRLPAPYLALLLCAFHVLRGRFGFFPWMCLCTGILLHGHAVMIVMALPVAGAVTLIHLCRTGRRLTRKDLVLVALGVVVGFTFMVPLLVEAMADGPSNVSLILGAATEPRRSIKLVDLIAAASQSIRPDFGILHLGLLLLGTLLVATYRARATDTWRTWLRLIGAVTLLMVVYFKTAVPGPIYDNMLAFFSAVPIATIVACSMIAFSDVVRISRARRVCLQLGVAVTAILSVLHLRPISVDPTNGSTIKELATWLSTEAGILNQPVTLALPEHVQWEHMSGLLLELHRRDIDACVTQPKLWYLFTSERICPSGTVATMELVRSAQCDGQCWFRGADLGLKPPDHAARP